MQPVDNTFSLPPFPFAVPEPPQPGMASHAVWFKTYAALETAACPYERGPMDLKLAHTRQVVDNARSICTSESMSDRETHACLLAALYHDVGRFLQYRIWKTFKDSQSQNHGLISAAILETCHVLQNEPDVASEVLDAVRWHNAPHLPKDMQDNVAAKVVRDADKIDILRVIDSHLSGPGPYEPTVILSLPDDPRLFSQRVIDCALNQSTASYGDLLSVNDFRLLLGSWVFALNYPSSRRMLASQGHVERLLAPLPQDIYGEAKKTILSALAKSQKAGA